MPLSRRLRQSLTGQNFSAAGARQAALAAGAVVFIAFAALFAGQNLRELERWGDGEAVKWYFNYEYHQALLFLRDLNLDLPVRMYTVRQHFDSSIRRFELPGARGVDGGEHFGGDGAIPPRNEVTEDSLFVLLDAYLPLAGNLESEYPDAVRIGQKTEGGQLLFVAYLVRAAPEASAAEFSPSP